MLYNGGALLWKLNLEASLSHILILKPAQFEDPFQNNGEMKAKFSFIRLKTRLFHLPSKNSTNLARIASRI